MSLRFTRFLLAAALGVLLAAPAAHAQVVFEDQFNGTSVDFSKVDRGPGNA